MDFIGEVPADFESSEIIGPKQNLLLISVIEFLDATLRGVNDARDAFLLRVIGNSSWKLSTELVRRTRVAGRGCGCKILLSNAGVALRKNSLDGESHFCRLGSNTGKVEEKRSLREFRRESLSTTKWTIQLHTMKKKLTICS